MVTWTKVNGIANMHSIWNAKCVYRTPQSCKISLQISTIDMAVLKVKAELYKEIPFSTSFCSEFLHFLF